MYVMYISKHNCTTKYIKNYSPMSPTTLSKLQEITTYIKKYLIYQQS